MEVMKMGKVSLSEEDIQIIDKFHGLLYQLAEILAENEAFNFYSSPSGEKIISIDELSSLMTEIEFKTNSKDFYFYLDWYDAIASYLFLFLDEYRLIYFILDKLGNIYYTLVTIKERKKKIKRRSHEKEKDLLSC